jgi:hypothetical protein
MQSGEQTFPSFPFPQELDKLYTRYKYGAILKDEEKWEGYK